MTRELDLPPIEELLPHRRSMLLLDRVNWFEEPEGEAEVTLNAGSTFMRDGAVRSVVAIEYMAQTAAACTVLAERGSGKAARGFLIAIPRMELAVPRFDIGDRLIIHGVKAQSTSDSASFDCVVRREDEVVASARLLIVRERGES